MAEKSTPDQGIEASAVPRPRSIDEAAQQYEQAVRFAIDNPDEWPGLVRDIGEHVEMTLDGSIEPSLHSMFVRVAMARALMGGARVLRQRNDPAPAGHLESHANLLLTYSLEDFGVVADELTLLRETVAHYERALGLSEQVH
jgi:hypothetical protein